MTTHVRFTADPGRAALLAWHRELASYKGDRARLRRAASLEEVAFVPVFHDLLRSLRGAGLGVRPERLALVAALAARVETPLGETEPSSKGSSEEDSAAGAMARARPGSDRPAVSDLRFQRLLACPEDDPELLLQRLARLLPLLGNRLNLPDLAETAYGWRSWHRRDWAYDYYRIAPRRSRKETPRG